MGGFIEQPVNPVYPLLPPLLWRRGISDGRGSSSSSSPIPGDSGPFKPQVLFGSFSNFHFLSPFEGSGLSGAARKTNTQWGSQHFLPQLQAFCLLPRWVSGCLLLPLGTIRPPEWGGGRSALWAFANWTWLEKGEGERREVLVTSPAG